MSQERKSELLQRTVHDLKNPLAVLRSSLEWLEVELAGRDDALDAVRDATTAASRMLSIVDDLDVLAHLEAGHELAREPFEICVVLGRVTASAVARLGARGMTVSSTSPASVGVRGDARVMARALDALIDACARGAGPGACVELTLDATGDDGVVVIDVGLRGEPSTGAPVASLDGHTGGGLGVYMAMMVAVAHGGSLLLVPTATTPRMLLRVPR